MGGKSRTENKSSSDTSVKTQNLSLGVDGESNTAQAVNVGDVSGMGNRITLTDSGAVARAVELAERVSREAIASAGASAGNALDFADTANRRAVDFADNSNRRAVDLAGDSLDLVGSAVARAATFAQESGKNALDMVQSAFTDDGAETVQVVARALAWTAAGLGGLVLVVYLVKES